jgi:glycosyltransferase involved in cell wall biosynthesis
MLEGEKGLLRKEFDKLLEWIAGEAVPDVINLPNTLLIGLAAPLRRAVGRPICCTLQGEDLFLGGLIEPYRSRAIGLIKQQVPQIDRFISVSEYYVPAMSKMLAIPLERIAVVPLGINLDGYAPAPERRRDPFRVGYFARVAPEKGLLELADAYILLRQRTKDARMRLDAAGYLAPAQATYLDSVKRKLAAAGLAGEFMYHGALDRHAKLEFLQSIDVLSVPATYDEPKGVFVLEAMAERVPVVQPRRGAFTEMVEKTGGGLLVPAGDSSALADGIKQLFDDPVLADRLATQGFDGVRQHYSIARSTDRLLAVYDSMIMASTMRPRDNDRAAGF